MVGLGELKLVLRVEYIYSGGQFASNVHRLSFLHEIEWKTNNPLKFIDMTPFYPNTYHLKRQKFMREECKKNTIGRQCRFIRDFLFSKKSNLSYG